MNEYTDEATQEVKLLPWEPLPEGQVAVQDAEDAGSEEPVEVTEPAVDPL